MLTFDEATHTYWLDGEEIPSVSRILDSKFGPPPDVPAVINAMHRGTRAHLATAYDDEGDLDIEHLEEVAQGDDEQAQWAKQTLGFVGAWRKFREKYEIEPREIEYIGWAEVDGVRYGFTIDRVAVIADELGVIDIKTTGAKTPPRHEKRHGFQLAAYALGYEFQAGMSACSRSTAMLWEDGRFRSYQYNQDHFLTGWRDLLRDYAQANEEAA